MSGVNKYKEISKSQRETRTKEIRQGTVAYVEQHVEDFEGFLVTEKRSQELDTLEVERQRTVKEGYTFMGQPTEYGDNILLQTLPLHLKNRSNSSRMIRRMTPSTWRPWFVTFCPRRRPWKRLRTVTDLKYLTFRTTTISGSHTTNTNFMGPPTITVSYKIRCEHVLEV
jgi:hypothetical protein